jgi:hypothetical protein
LKCSGDHPVCHRCTARGLICQYSSREPRPRGPSKARLRNAISSVELRTPQNQHSIQSERHGIPLTPLALSLKQIQQYRSQEFVDNGQSVIPHRRVASLPRSHHDSRHYLPSSSVMSTHVYDNHDVLPLSYGSHSYNGSHGTPPMQIQPDRFNNQHLKPRYREVRRVQSHSTLISGGREHQYDLHSAMPFRNEFGGPASYETFNQTHMSPVSPPMLGPFDGNSLRPQFAHQMQRPAELHPWGYHSDGGSSG